MIHSRQPSENFQLEILPPFENPAAERAYEEYDFILEGIMPVRMKVIILSVIWLKTKD